MFLLRFIHEQRHKKAEKQKKVTLYQYNIDVKESASNVLYLTKK